MASATTGAQEADICAESDIPLGEGRVAEVGGLRIAVFRSRSGKVYATQAECPHRGGPLADGLLGDATVVCPLHEFKFDLPSGRALENTCPALKTYPVTVTEDGRLLLRFAPQAAVQLVAP